jgi:hypothetical protein
MAMAVPVLIKVGGGAWMGVRAGVAMRDGKCGTITMASLKQMWAYSCLLDSGV